MLHVGHQPLRARLGDGDCDELSDHDIATVVERAADAQAATDTLVSQALAAGGHDNVTVIVVSTSAAEAPAAASAEVTAPRVRVEGLADD